MTAQWVPRRYSKNTSAIVLDYAPFRSSKTLLEPNAMLRRTKIVSTLGPATDEPGVLEKLILAAIAVGSRTSVDKQPLAVVGET